MPSALDILLPRPRRAIPAPGLCCIPAAPRLALIGGPSLTDAAALRLREAFPAAVPAASGVAADIAFAIESGTPPEGYRLTVTPAGIRARAADRAGLFYAAVTLARLAAPGGGAVPCGTIEDSPDFPVRGVMLDISRDKVPTMATLRGLVARLADLKFNHLELYLEHAFAYAAHPDVWHGATPLTPAEARELDSLCAARCIDLVPNQNSFGHLERWLALPRYRPLAELPQGGAPLPWGGFQREPSALCPTDPRSLAFLDSLYAELLPNFRSRLFNVGCDETFDLRGPGRSQAEVLRLGEGRVYLGFLEKIHGLCAARGRRMAFWGDIITRFPELVPRVPRDALLLEWGYEADHPFAARAAAYAASGLDYCVCPGTSAWRSLSGRCDNMLANIRSAALAGKSSGARGLIVADWGDAGHWNPLALSLPGFAAAAEAAWCLAAGDEATLPARADRCLTAGRGGLLARLGRLHLLAGALRGNSTELFHLLADPRGQAVPPGVTPETLARTDEVARALEDEVGRGPGDVLAREIGFCCRAVRAACLRGRFILAGGAPGPELAGALAALRREHRAVWLLRNRPGGLEDSAGRFPAV